jgi:two-component system, NarL family, sensor histidine kinase YdfH
MKKLIPLFLTKKEDANEIPFFVFLTVILLGIAAWSIVDSPALRQPIHLVPFIALLLGHIILYWLAIRLKKELKWRLGYIAVQGAVAFAISLIADNIGVVLGLYMALVGMAIGLLGLNRWGLGALVFILGLSVTSYLLQTGWNQVGWWALAVPPEALFVIVYVALYTRQSEARARAQALAAELESANRRLADYADRVEDLTLANERQRMARELHDTLSQGLAGLILQLEAVQAHLEQGRVERGSAIVSQAMLQARATLADARAAISDLRTQTPASGDLMAALVEEMRRFGDATGIPCQLEVDLPEGACAELPAELCEPVRKVAAEALTNIARHARASQVEVSLGCAEGGLQICVRDNGAGFEIAAAESQAGHYGLLGMRERARLAGGTLEVTSQPGQGTVICLKVPFKKR